MVNQLIKKSGTCNTTTQLCLCSFCSSYDSRDDDYDDGPSEISWSQSAWIGPLGSETSQRPERDISGPGRPQEQLYQRRKAAMAHRGARAQAS